MITFEGKVNGFVRNSDSFDIARWLVGCTPIYLLYLNLARSRLVGGEKVTSFLTAVTLRHLHLSISNCRTVCGWVQSFSKCAFIAVLQSKTNCGKRRGISPQNSSRGLKRDTLSLVQNGRAAGWVSVPGMQNCTCVTMAHLAEARSNFRSSSQEERRRRRFNLPTDAKTSSRPRATALLGKREGQ